MNTAKLVNPILTERKQNKVNTAIFTFFHLHSIPWITLIFILASCNTTQPPPPPGSKGAIQLTVEDVSSTEVWLNVKTQNINLPAELKLFREDSVTQIFNLRSPDTLLYNNDLLPNKTYNYKASYTGSGQTNIQSQTVTAATMDTTSHNFTWQTYTFGGANGSSVLNDVAIINENDIWAVGEIHTTDTDQFDSNGVWVQPYNAVHWDGQKWGLKRFYFKDFCNQQTTHVYPIRAIIAFPNDNIFITSGSQIINFNKNNQSLPECIPVSVNSMWGTSSEDFYVVGNNGNIAHYNGSVWTKINSGTELNINDIWGDFNQETSTYEILAVASNVFSSLDRTILSIDPNTQRVTKLLTQPINGTLSSVWFKSKSKYYVTGGGGNFEKHNLSEIYWKHSISSILRHSILKIRCNGLNDVFGAGGAGEVLHFNGITTKSYYNTTKLAYGNYYSIAVKGNTVVAVGEDNPTAVLIIGKR